MFETRMKSFKTYEERIKEIESKPIEKGKILFVGSSGFTRWSERHGNRPLEEDIRMKDGSPAAVNNGFGGCTAEEILYYYDRVIRPWEPRALVLRVFPNDVGMGYSPSELMFLCSRILAWARYDFPGIKLYLCDASPNVCFYGAGWNSRVKQFNEMVKDYCNKHDDTTAICHITHPGFFSDPADIGDYDKVRPDIFIEDKTHFTQEGYDIYRDLFLKALDDIL